MFRSNILDTLIFCDFKIYLKHFHSLRTFDTFKFLNINLNFSEIETIYNEIEILYRDKVKKNESLKIIFLNKLPLSYTVKIQQIHELNPVIQLQTTQLLSSEVLKYTNYKWEDRTVWNNLLKDKKNDADDVLVINSQNYVIETSKFNIFCYDKHTDKIYTPELQSGCLNGVFRRHALDQVLIDVPQIGKKELLEKQIQQQELSSYQIYVGNSVRGLLQAVLV